MKDCGFSIHSSGLPNTCTFVQESLEEFPPETPLEGGHEDTMQESGISGGGCDGGEAARRAEKRGIDNERGHQFFMRMEITLKVIIKSKY